MYNSILIGGLVRLWNLFSSSYGESLLKKIIDKIKSFISYLFKYSVFKSIFVSKDSLIFKSVFFKGIYKIILFLDKILNRIHKFFMAKTSGSLVYKNIDNLFKDNKQIIKTISIFVVSIFMGIILNDMLIFQKTSSRGYIVAIIFMAIGIFTIKVSNNYLAILDNSVMWKFVSGLFTIDEGGENWW